MHINNLQACILDSGYTISYTPFKLHQKHANRRPNIVHSHFDSTTGKAPALSIHVPSVSQALNP